MIENLKAMNLGDLNKIWEIKALKRKPNQEEARKILDRVAKQVQPIMRNHKWRVKLLSEFCPKNPALLGLNVGSGIHVKLRLRRPNRDEEFIPFHEVLDTMLHELCHNAHGPHNASFYKLWDEIRKECEDLINKGVSGTGQGFDLPGRRLGGISLKPSLSLRQSTLTAAENRARLGTLLPSGPKQVGGDTSIMVSLSPLQAAAMAAEMRLRDNIWCGSEFCDDCEEDENMEPLTNFSDSRHSSGISNVHIGYDRKDLKTASRKRSREFDDLSILQPDCGHPESTFVDLQKASSKSGSIFHPVKKLPNKTCLEESKSHAQSSCGDKKYNIIDLSREASTSLSIPNHEPVHDDDCNTWPCAVCTLLNPPLAPICELCRTQKPKDNNLKFDVWLCKFCTLENDVKLEKCAVCGAWRYSYGPPVAASAPNLGT